MSGLQELAAVLGITEVAFRAISSLYEFVKDLRDVPLEIERIKAETATLDRTLRYLSSLDTAHIELAELAEETGLALAVNRCGAACDRLLRDLYRWTTGSRHSAISRIQFRLHKREIDNVTAEISAAKQTTILALGVAQICLQLGKPVSESEKILRIKQGQTEIAMISTKLKPDSDMSRPRSPSSLLSEPSPHGKAMIVYKRDDGRPEMDEKATKAGDSLPIRGSRSAPAAPEPAPAAREPAKASISIKKSSTGEGNRNLVGTVREALPDLANLEIEDSYTAKGDDNCIGIAAAANPRTKARKSRSSHRK